MTEILVCYKQMRALMKVLDPSNQFKSLAAHLAAIVAFNLAALLSPWAGDASLNDDNNVVK